MESGEPKELFTVRTAKGERLFTLRGNGHFSHTLAEGSEAEWLRVAELISEQLRIALAQLDAAQAETKRLTDAVRWALGEDGEFTNPPDILIDRLSVGKMELKDQYPVSQPSHLYWWRSELHDKAFAGVSPEATEGSDHA